MNHTPYQNLEQNTTGGKNNCVNVKSFVQNIKQKFDNSQKVFTKIQPNEEQILIKRPSFRNYLKTVLKTDDHQVRKNTTDKGIKNITDKSKLEKKIDDSLKTKFKENLGKSIALNLKNNFKHFRNKGSYSSKATGTLHTNAFSNLQKNDTLKSKLKTPKSSVPEMKRKGSILPNNNDVCDAYESSKKINRKIEQMQESQITKTHDENLAESLKGRYKTEASMSDNHTSFRGVNFVDFSTDKCNKNFKESVEDSVFNRDFSENKTFDTKSIESISLRNLSNLNPHNNRIISTNEKPCASDKSLVQKMVSPNSHDPKTQRISFSNYYNTTASSKNLAPLTNSQKNDTITNRLSKPKVSNTKNGVAHAFAINSYKGRENSQMKTEDRVTIFFDLVKMGNDKNCPFSYFGLYQGINGSGCASYLRDNLHKMIINSKYFPKNVYKAVKEACVKVDYEFIMQAISKPDVDKSGSTSVIF